MYRNQLRSRYIAGYGHVIQGSGIFDTVTNFLTQNAGRAFNAIANGASKLFGKATSKAADFASKAVSKAATKASEKALDAIGSVASKATVAAGDRIGDYIADKITKPKKQFQKEEPKIVPENQRMAVINALKKEISGNGLKFI